MADRTLVTVAGAALTAAGALAFARVFDSGGFVAPTIGAAFVPFLIGTTLRRLRMPTVTIVATSLATGALYMLLAVERWNPLEGWPDGATLRENLRAGWEAARTEVPPVMPTTGTILLLVGATWLTALVVDQMLVRDASTGAIVPPLALFVVATALGIEQGGLTVTIGFAVAAVALLLVQHHSIVTRRRGRFLGRETGHGTGLLMAGTVLGVVAVVTGLAIAPAVPGADAGPLLDYRGITSGRGAVYEPGIAPILDVGQRLQRGDRSEVFRVRAPEAAYWRMVALDEYDGNWVLDAPAGSIDVGLDQSIREPFVQEFTIGSLGEKWMPAAYQPRNVEGGNPMVIRDSATLITAEDSVNGLRYRVESELPVALGGVTPDLAAGTSLPLSSDLARYTELPEGFSSTIAAAADEAVAGAVTPFDRALALRNFFRDPSFTYDPGARYNASGTEDGEAVIEAFLEQRNGFCVQFAGAYAVMARSLGIPTRIAIGFTPGERQGEEFVVTNHEAHAWPEVYLAGIGWTNMFDPTPPSALPGGSALPGETPPSTAAGTPSPTTTPTAAVPTTVPETIGGQGETGVEVGTPNAGDGAGTGRWIRIVAIASAVVALGIAYIGALLGMKRRRRTRRRRAAPSASIIGAWREALDRLDEAHRPTPVTSTPRELADELTSAAPDAGAALRELAGAYCAARYGPERLGPKDANRAWETVVVFEEALVADVPVTTRWRRRLRRARGAP